MSPTFTILTVCTGNICRSPAMERLLAHLFRDEPEVQVISAGTYAHDGEDMQEPMKRRIADYGAATADFVAEQVTAEMIERSDLILAATGVHVRDMLAEVPAAAEKMFTHIQFGQLLDAADLQRNHAQGETAAAKLADLVPAMNRMRQQAGNEEGQEDVVDPYMLPESVFDESFRQIREPVEKLAEVLGLRELLSQQ